MLKSEIRKCAMAELRVGINPTIIKKIVLVDDENLKFG